MQEIRGYFISKFGYEVAVLDEIQIKTGDSWSNGICYIKNSKLFCSDREEFLKDFDKK